MNVNHGSGQSLPIPLLEILLKSKTRVLAPLILMQRDKHYRSLCLDNEDEPIPDVWLERTEGRDNKFYRGGMETKRRNSSAIKLAASTKSVRSALSFGPSGSILIAFLLLVRPLAYPSQKLSAQVKSTIEPKVFETEKQAQGWVCVVTA